MAEGGGGGGWGNYKGKMINIRNVTMKPSGRSEGQGGEEERRREGGGMSEQTEMGGRLSTEKNTIHLRVQMKNARGVKSNGWIDRLIEKDEMGQTARRHHLWQGFFSGAFGVTDLQICGHKDLRMWVKTGRD